MKEASEIDFRELGRLTRIMQHTSNKQSKSPTVNEKCRHCGNNELEKIIEYEGYTDPNKGLQPGELERFGASGNPDTFKWQLLYCDNCIDVILTQAHFSDEFSVPRGGYDNLGQYDPDMYEDAYSKMSLLHPNRRLLESEDIPKKVSKSYETALDFYLPNDFSRGSNVHAEFAVKIGMALDVLLSVSPLSKDIFNTTQDRDELIDDLSSKILRHDIIQDLRIISKVAKYCSRGGAEQKFSAQQAKHLKTVFESVLQWMLELDDIPRNDLKDFLS